MMKSAGAGDGRWIRYRRGSSASSVDPPTRSATEGRHPL
jgi:hypothetical protein